MGGCLTLTDGNPVQLATVLYILPSSHSRSLCVFANLAANQDTYPYLVSSDGHMCPSSILPESIDQTPTIIMSVYLGH
eukprot:scaffold34381_cov178-Skeletonema_dohrnii-CCMP3373.AAC.1